MRIAIGGQLEKIKLAENLKILWPEADLTIETDINAAMAVSSAECDYYIGACITGSGGALALAMAILGAKRCISLASPSRIFSFEEIHHAIFNEEKIAFGMTSRSIEKVLPQLVEVLKEKSNRDFLSIESKSAR